VSDNLRGPIESRLLAVERGLSGLERELRQLRRQAIAVGQGLWDSWGDTPIPRQAPAAAKFPNICPGPDDIPDVITLVDPVYGDVDLTWDGVSAWTGCQVINYPGFGVCPAATSCPITYTLTGSNTTAVWELEVAWIDHTVSGQHCPLAGQSCGSAPTISFTHTATIACSGTTAWTFNAGFIYAGNTTPTFSITLP